MVSGVTLHERSTTLYGSFQHNPVSELKVDMNCYRIYWQSALNCNELSYTENTVTAWYISLNTRYTYGMIIYCCQHLYNVHLEYNNNLLYKLLINKRLIKITHGTNSVPY